MLKPPGDESATSAAWVLLPEEGLQLKRHLTMGGQLPIGDGPLPTDEGSQGSTGAPEAVGKGDEGRAAGLRPMVQLGL